MDPPQTPPPPNFSQKPKFNIFLSLPLERKLSQTQKETGIGNIEEKLKEFEFKILDKLEEKCEASEKRLCKKI